MQSFQPAQTILNYIYHNKEDVIKHIRVNNQTITAQYLTQNNLADDKISQPKLNHIMQYILEEIECQAYSVTI